MPSPGSVSPPVAATEKAASRFEQQRSRSRQRKQQQQHDAVDAADKSGQPWYKEVVELRKQANEFRVRLNGSETTVLFRSKLNSGHFSTRKMDASANGCY